MPHKIKATTQNSTAGHTHGFTLIELLITTSLTVLLMLTITTMFMTFLLGNSKTNVRKSIKEEGLHAISQMEFIIKNAHYFDEDASDCLANQNSITIVGLDGGSTTYSTVSDGGVNKIASTSATATTHLTSSTVTLSNLLFDCSGDVGNRQIRIRFQLDKDAPTLGSDSNLSESFETTVTMRN